MLESRWWGPLGNPIEFRFVHLDSSVVDYETQKIDFFDEEIRLVWLDNQVVLFQGSGNSLSPLNQLGEIALFSTNQYIVHEDFKPFLRPFSLEDLVH